MKTNTETKVKYRTKVDAGKKLISSQPVWRWPLLINTIALVGIIAALIGHGWLDILSWLCLGASVAVIFYAYYLAPYEK